ncbi:hypothetical protein NQ317_003926 [Molorchus minor]|uniref:Golgi integral membrane protein 4 n=1 Tax=Molorchus minor TaxID=1323400 RepID=A0ABQ9IVL7_9CUCU|nr:hypothetical protein NQ317_003926 [Molorchus minor]
MTTTRVIRGTRAKIFLYVCVVLILIGLIACYNNSLVSQLDYVKTSNTICHQQLKQQRDLTAELEVISDYKQRLERSLKTEKAEHQQTKTYLESKLKEETDKYEKHATDSKLKLNSLQQNYDLLETRYEDFKEECTKKINELQSQVKEINEEFKKIQNAKESLKMQIEKENLERQINDIQVNKNENESHINHLTKENNELKRDLESMKEKCSTYDTLQEPNQNIEVSSLKASSKVSEMSPSLNQLQPNSQSEASVLNMLQVEKQEKNVLAVPNSDDGKSAFSKPSTKSGLKPSQASLNGARPLLLPLNYEKQKLPDGVVAIPKKEESIPNESEIINNRYQIAKESVNEPVVNKIGQNNFDGLAFGDNNQVKHAEKQNLEKNHIDSLGAKDKKVYDQDQMDYKDLQNEGEDDDDYPDNIGAAVRPGPAERN